MVEESELPGHCDVVALGPVLGDLAVFDPVDVDRVDLESLACWRLAHELTGVGSAGCDASGDLVARAEGILNS
jgi:hypothetical protein